MNTQCMKTTAVMENCFELWSAHRLAGPVTCLSAPSKRLGAVIMTLGLLVCGRSAYPQATGQGVQPHFEPAFADVPAGSNCIIHPEDNPDPSQSISVRPDADGVVRFLAVRPTLPNSVNRLSLDCTDSQGNANTYPIDLRSEETFADRPFDPLRANLAVRPPLTGDPLSFTQDQLVEAGYGLRPDPTSDPELYQAWLAAASEPAYKLRGAQRASFTPLSLRPVASVGVPSDNADSIALNAGTYLSPSNYWTGAILRGSYKKGATSAKTYSYVLNQSTFTVPAITPNIFSTKTTALTIWNGLDNVFQAIVDVQATPTAGRYGIHRQNFYHDLPKESIDEQGVDFTPKSGDEIFVEEWYCDSKGHVKMTGGYGCSIMIDKTQKIEWECDQSKSSECQSYPIESKFLANGALGQTAEYIIEDDSGEVSGNCPSPKTNCYDEWVDISPVTMTGSALVVQGTSATGKTVTTSTDPNVALLTDTTASVPFVFGDRHFIISLPTGATKWSGLVTNVYYWDGTNFDNLSTPQTSTTAQPGVIFGCASWVAVGPNTRGLTSGTPWITGCHESADGNRDVYQMQTGGAWVKMQSDIATQLAVSPEGDVWAINAKGDIFYWNGSKFVANPTGGCATAIAVGPNSHGLTHGTPWATGCHKGTGGNYNVYQMQTDGKWVLMQSDVAAPGLSVSPEGNPWALNAAGQILYWNGSKFVENAAGGCAISIGVGPNSRGLTKGTPWITGCTPESGISPIYNVYQMQTGGKWVKMQSYAGLEVAVSPEGNAWVINVPLP